MTKTRADGSTSKNADVVGAVGSSAKKERQGKGAGSVFVSMRREGGFGVCFLCTHVCWT